MSISSATTNWSRIDNVTLKFNSLVKRSKNKVYFDDFYDDDIVDYKRKYVNNWSELRVFVGLDDVDLEANELSIINMSGYIKSKQKIYKTHDWYNVTRILSGMAGLAFTS